MDLQALGSLEYINLSRNLIREIMPGTFLGMANLKGLDFSVNVVRKVRHIFLSHYFEFPACCKSLRVKKLLTFISYYPLDSWFQVSKEIVSIFT